jgi:hypothetical protein
VEAVTVMAEFLQSATAPEAVGLGLALVLGFVVALELGFGVVDALVVGLAVGEADGPAAEEEPSSPRPVSNHRTPRSSATSTTSTMIRRNQ